MGAGVGEKHLSRFGLMIAEDAELRSGCTFTAIIP